MVRDSVALVQPGDGWSHAERVVEKDLDSWRDEKAMGPGRDKRLLAATRDAGGARFLSLMSLMSLLTQMEPRPKSAAASTMTTAGGSTVYFPKDWPFRGPSTTLELVRSIRAAGVEILAYSAHWARCLGLRMVRLQRRNIET